MNTFLKRAIWPILVIPPIYLLLSWNSVPEKIAMQFDLQGNPTRIGNKTELLAMVFILMLVSLLTYLLLVNIYRIDPKKFAAENKDRLRRIAFAVVIFITALQCLIIYSAVAGIMKLSMGVLFAGIGLLFAIIGNYMPNLKPNYFAGLRLPWTLENEDNWKKTHLLAGKLWFAGGLLLAVICLFVPSKAAVIVFYSITAIIVIIPCVYSFLLYRKQRSVN